MKNENLDKYIQERMTLVQTQFDTTKSTLLTAGLLVAISISIPGLEDVGLWGYSGIKVVMACAITSSIFQVLSFVFAENQVKRHDKLNGGTTITTIEKLITNDNAELQAKIIPWFYGAFHNKLISIANDLSTLLLIAALSLFLYCLILS